MAKKGFLMFALVWLLGGCYYRPIFYPKYPTDGPPLYQMGFKDGCDTGMTVYGNDVVRLTNKGNVNPELMRNKIYLNAWRVGNKYCQKYLNQMQGEGWFVKDFPRPVYGNRMKPNDENLFRERMTDSFWRQFQFTDQPWGQMDSRFFQMENGDEQFGGMGAGMFNFTTRKHNEFGVKSMI